MKTHERADNQFYGALQEGVAVRPIEMGVIGGWGRNRTRQFKLLKMGLLVFVTPFVLHRFFEKPTRFQCLINSKA